MISGAMRRFNHAWFDQYKNWLEYSIKKDAAYCLCCYLFRDSNGKGGKTDALSNEGFSSWNKFSRLAEHVGQVNSFHNNAVMKCENLMRQGLPFRGPDESETSANKRNFMELRKYTAEQNEAVSKVVLQNAPGNNLMVSSKIQKYIAHCFAEEVIKSIFEEIDHDVFCLLVGESANVSDKEQMAVVFWFVDKSGNVKERFISIIHVAETSSAYLKSAIDSLFAKLGLGIKLLRGQGYDSASNMKCEYNGLRSPILRENTSAYCVHCFAHQLQLVVVAVAKKHFEVGGFFDMISLLLNVVGASWLNQEVAIQRPGQTRWGSHYKTLLRLIELFSPIINVLKHIQNESLEDSKRRQAYGLLVYFQDFDFVFYLQMMVHLLGLTDSLSKALQQRDQDILNAMSLVKLTKR
uniref:TTF-type domain-containing protein n=1 Tax=Brassica oleracea var. oleracea TaxID=109376 RepID=A0A0D3CGD6_BRAOL